ATISFVNTSMRQGNLSRRVGLRVQPLATMSARPAGGGSVLSSEQFRLRVSGVAGDTYVLQATTDLVHWTSLGTNTAASDGSIEFSDADARQLPRRFYRAVNASSSQ